jgi:hypothetical protein
MSSGDRAAATSPYLNSRVDDGTDASNVPALFHLWQIRDQQQNALGRLRVECFGIEAS